MIAGRYSLGREIGRGGSGTVHLAHDEVLGRTVAIKRIGVMPGADDADMQRAEREARLAASLNHPHVVAVFDLVEEDGCHWLVMEYVEGQTLSQLVADRGPLDTTAAAALLAQTADALSDAHDGGIVHRDVKPSNILVSDGVAKLSDFGIARSANDASLTQTGLVTGSPAYLAPEVASGSSATSASDVWSLGATLFHAVSGRPPYDVGSNLIGALYKIVHEEPPTLAAGHPMAGLLGVMLVRDPQERWPMRRVRDELQRLADGQQSQVPARPVATAPPPEPTGVLPAVRTTPLPSAAHSAERHHRRWGLMVLAAVLAVVAVVSAYYLAGRGTPEAASQTTGTSQTSAPSETSEPSATATSEVKPATAKDTKAQMDAFMTTYLATVTTDPEAAFEQLTPEFRESSGGYAGYLGFWGTVRSASLAQIDSNPSDLTVGYTVNYVMQTGRQITQNVRLQLQRQDDRLLIAGEG
ncbi:MAG: serine/threonine protein kinase [Nocardioides sp.]|nr:serine/threonine protein kinase [Nocardioides sp.]